MINQIVFPLCIARMEAHFRDSYRPYHSDEGYSPTL